MPVDDVPAAWGLALSLALVSEFCVVIAAQSFRFAALVDRRVRWRWYVFPVVFAVPIAGSITVLNYMTAPAAIVTATRGYGIMWNILLAPFTVGEAVTTTRAWGAAVLVVGVLLVGFMGPHTATERTATEYLALFGAPVALTWICMLGLSIFINLALWWRRVSSPHHGQWLTICIASSYALASLFFKVTAELGKCFLDDTLFGCRDDAGHPIRPAQSPTFWSMASATLVLESWGPLLFALASYSVEILESGPMVVGTFIIFTALNSTLVLRETARLDTLARACYLGGLCCLMLGLCLLTMPELQELLIRSPHRELHLSTRAREVGLSLRRRFGVPEPGGGALAATAEADAAAAEEAERGCGERGGGGRREDVGSGAAAKRGPLSESTVLLEGKR